MIDNSILSFAYHLDNGIPIIPFYDDKKDIELKNITLYLLENADKKDLTEINKKYFHLQQ